MVTTLEELKAENAKLEAEESTPPQVEEETVEEDATETPLEETEEAAETSDENTKEIEVEAWMQEEESSGDDQASPADHVFTGSDIKKAKTKLKAKLERKHSEEIEKLNARIEELESSQSSSDLNKPKREDFYDSDDPDEAYADALVDYKFKKHMAQQAAKSQEATATRQQIERQQQVEKGLDQHYERAAKLAEKSGITPELYQSADYQVRQAIDNVFPKSGDAITDALIADLGEGSEKVFYNLGVNRGRLNKLTSLLKQDPKGIRAAVYLGQLGAELAAPQKRTTRAPAPSPEVKGDQQQSAEVSKLQRKYKEAHKSGNTQAAFDARMEAKRAGVDVSNW